MTLPSMQTPGPDHAAGEPVETPTPVVDAAKQVGGLVAAAILAVGLLWFALAEGVTRDNIGTVATLGGAAVTALVALAAYLWALRKGRQAAEEVTPLAKPRDDLGRRLVPESRDGRA